MERKTLTLKRPSTPEQPENPSTPVVTARRKQVVINTTRRPTKSVKAAPTKNVALKKGKPPVKPPEVIKDKKVVPPTPPKKHLPLDEAMVEISTYWPNLFPAGQLRPMAIGTQEMLFAYKAAKNLGISVKKLKRCLSAISHSLKYRTTLMPGAVRYDKDGQPAGNVTDSDVADTLSRIQRIAKQGVRLENGKYPTLRLFFVQLGINCA